MWLHVCQKMKTYKQTFYSIHQLHDRKGATHLALRILWSGVMDWSLGLESWSGVLEWILGVEP